MQKLPVDIEDEVNRAVSAKAARRPNQVTDAVMMARKLVDLTINDPVKRQAVRAALEVRLAGVLDLTTHEGGQMTSDQLDLVSAVRQCRSTDTEVLANHLGWPPGKVMSTYNAIGPLNVDGSRAWD